MTSPARIARSLPIGGTDIDRCLTRIHHDRFTPAVFEIDDVTARLFEAGNAYEDDVLDRLRSLYPSAETIEPGGDTTEATLRAMDRRVPILFGARLEDSTGTRVGLPDMLVWMGDGYAPVDVKNHLVVGSSGRHAHTTPLGEIQDSDGRPARFRTGRTRDLMQATHYWALLEGLGHASSGRVVGVIGSDEPSQCLWVSLEDEHSSLIEHLDDYLREADTTISHGFAHPDQPMIPPAFKPECDQCPWTDRCVDELKAIDDPTLLRGVSSSDRDRLLENGVSTIAEIASLDLASDLVGSSTLVRRARAYTMSQLLRSDNGRGPLPLPDEPIEVDFDIETYQGRIYLAGLMITDASGSRFEPIADWSGTPDGERELLVELFARLDGFARANIPVFHWTDYEANLLSAGAERHGLALGSFPSVSAWFDGHAVDLCAWSRSHLTSPNGYSLKVIAPLCGFEWRDDDPGGRQSEVWFEALLEGAEDMRQRLLEYNEDDVAAQLAVRTWVRGQDDGSGPGTGIPSVLTWPPA